MSYAHCTLHSGCAVVEWHLHFTNLMEEERCLVFDFSFHLLASFNLLIREVFWLNQWNTCNKNNTQTDYLYSPTKAIQIRSEWIGSIASLLNFQLFRRTKKLLFISMLAHFKFVYLEHLFKVQFFSILILFLSSKVHRSAWPI